MDQVRTALETAKVGNASSAEIQSVTNQKLGPNVFEIQGKIPLGARSTARVQAARSTRPSASSRRTASRARPSARPSAPQVARSAVIAIIFSLLVISAYVAIRFEAKYAIPVIIALLHDILITAASTR